MKKSKPSNTHFQQLKSLIQQVNSLLDKIDENIEKTTLEDIESASLEELISLPPSITKRLRDVLFDSSSKSSKD